jgi:hypothetical protein
MYSAFMPADRIQSSEITFLIQGSAYIKNGTNLTRELSNDIKILFPLSRIVFSSWSESDFHEIEVDKKVISSDPGSYVYNSVTSQENNINRQIQSTLSGLREVETEYCIKLRSDMRLGSQKLIRALNRIPRVGQGFEVPLENRVGILNITSVNPRFHYKLLHHPCDWVYMGKTQDLIKIWDIPLMSTQDACFFSNSTAPEVDSFLPRYRSEAYIWQSFLKKYVDLDFGNSYDFSEKRMKISEAFFANLTMVFSMHQLGLYSSKHTVRLQNRTNMYCGWDLYLLSKRQTENRISFRFDRESSIVYLYRVWVLIKRIYSSLTLSLKSSLSR